SKNGQRESVTFAEFVEKRRRRTLGTKNRTTSVNQGEVESLPHSAAVSTRLAFRGAHKDYKNDTLIPGSGHQFVNLSVTEPHLERALSLVDRLAWLFDRNGFDFTERKGRHRPLELTLRETGTTVSFSLRETLD